MIPNFEEERKLCKEYNKGDFHLLHGEAVSGITGFFACKYDSENWEQCAHKRGRYKL
ncbi:hypothetical protein MUJ63_03630 [Lachnospiraceae bacterium NSJ-143]|mgnify:CR=1 FL=1|nr:hypothetical protein [Lachnospiraceae bacterium NSJ-143]